MRFSTVAAAGFAVSAQAAVPKRSIKDLFNGEWEFPEGVSISKEELVGPWEAPSDEDKAVFHPSHHGVVIDDCDKTDDDEWHWVHPGKEHHEEDHKWVTETITATETVVDCDYDGPCDGGKKTKTVTIPETTTICPTPIEEPEKPEDEYPEPEPEKPEEPVYPEPTEVPEEPKPEPEEPKPEPEEPKPEPEPEHPEEPVYPEPEPTEVPVYPEPEPEPEEPVSEPVVPVPPPSEPEPSHEVPGPEPPVDEPITEPVQPPTDAAPEPVPSETAPVEPPAPSEGADEGEDEDVPAAAAPNAQRAGFALVVAAVAAALF